MEPNSPHVDISIVIPVYNEEGSVLALYREITEVMRTVARSYEIIFVNDGSTDKTVEVLRTLHPVTVISFTKNFGKTQALQAAFRRTQGEFIFTLDGDLQDDPQEIPRFLALQAETHADLVCGWKQNRLDPLSKRLPSKVANAITARSTGVRVHDMNCCFKLYSRRVVKQLVLFGDMHRYIPAVVHALGYKVVELSIHHRARKHGKSKYGLRRMVNSIFDFLTLILTRKFSDRPMYLFGQIGITMSLLGSLILVYLSYVHIFFDEKIGGRPLLLLGVLLIVVGFQSFSLGFLGELSLRMGADKEHYVIDELIQRD